MTLTKPGPLVSIIVPVYNEERLVRASLERLRAIPLRLEVVCVDDGSVDGTAQVLRELADESTIDRMVVHPSNRGKGEAVRSGLEQVRGEVVAIHDADLEYDPADLPRMLELIIAGEADAVFGSRFAGEPRGAEFFWHEVGNRMLTRLSNALTGMCLTDMETCYKMIRTDLLRSLPLSSPRFGFEPEVTARLAQAGARVREIPISYYGRTYAEGKKIGWRDGVAALWQIARSHGWGPRPPRWPNGAA